MWTIISIIVFIPTVGFMPLNPSHEVFGQPPAMTEEACHVAAWDAVMESQRRKGIWSPFNITCKVST